MPSLPKDVERAIDHAAKQSGLSRDFIRKLVMHESSGNPKAFNKSSQAQGLFQMLPKISKAYGVKDPYNPMDAASGAAKLLAENRDGLRRVLGREPTDNEVYLAYQQGLTGARKLLQNPQSLASDIVGSRAVLGNRGAENMTAQQFADQVMSRFGGAQGAPSPVGLQRVIPTPQPSPLGNTQPRLPMAGIPIPSPNPMSQFRVPSTAPIPTTKPTGVNSSGVFVTELPTIAEAIDTWKSGKKRQAIGEGLGALSGVLGNIAGHSQDQILNTYNAGRATSALARKILGK